TSFFSCLSQKNEPAAENGGVRRGRLLTAQLCERNPQKLIRVFSRKLRIPPLPPTLVPAANALIWPKVPAAPLMFKLGAAKLGWFSTLMTSRRNSNCLFSMIRNRLTIFISRSKNEGPRRVE